MCISLATIICIIVMEIFHSNGQLLWNDPTTSDLHCTYPPAIGFPQHIITAVSFTLYYGSLEETLRIACFKIFVFNLSG